jgi:hypothetical protein
MQDTNESQYFTTPGGAIMLNGYTGMLQKLYTDESFF